jgi:hypothetical protein
LKDWRCKKIPAVIWLTKKFSAHLSAGLLASTATSQYLSLLAAHLAMAIISAIVLTSPIILIPGKLVKIDNFRFFGLR